MKILKLTPPTKDYIWGGTRLSKEYGILSFEDRQAEAWMLSCHEAGQCVIENGSFKGRTLSDVLSDEGKGYLGTNCERFESFPILTSILMLLIIFPFRCIPTMPTLSSTRASTAKQRHGILLTVTMMPKSSTALKRT